MLVDATTAVEDRTLLGEQRVRPRRHHLGRRRRPPRPRPRRLDDHPAARPPAPPERRERGRDRGHREPQGQGDHPVDPRHAGLPGRGRQAADHGRLPQPELLRQRVVRRGGRGPWLLRRRAHGPDARPGGDPRGAPPVALDLRPRRERRRGVRGPGRPTPRRARRPSSSSPTTPRSSSAATTCCPRCRRRAARRSPASELTAARLRRPPRASRSSLAPQRIQAVARPAVRVAGPRGAHRPAVRRGRRDLPADRARRPDRHDHDRPPAPGHRREVGQGRDHRPARRRTRSRRPGPSASATSTGCATCATRRCATAR